MILLSSDYLVYEKYKQIGNKFKNKMNNEAYEDNKTAKNNTALLTN